MKSNELLHWTALRRVEGVGNLGFKTLVDTLGSPEEVFAAPVNDLASIPGMSLKVAKKIKSFDDWTFIKEEAKLLADKGASVITYKDDSYPRSLLNIFDFPVLIYFKGTIKEDDIDIAVVGSRTATTYGKFCTDRLCRELAANGVTIVSGMARGIDSAAHRGAIAAKGRTIAVLGSGIDVIYPQENTGLFKQIIDSGAVITEFPPGTPPTASNFPSRNRIISGLSWGVVVVEATDKSGSLITAKIALEQGRDVFAVPGSVDSPTSRGPHRLIKEGAKLVENANDIMVEILPQLERVRTDKQPTLDPAMMKTLPSNKGEKSKTELNETERSLISHISAFPVHIDEIIGSTGLKPAEVLNILLNMEIKGVVTQLPGKRFTRKE
ncbi:MAG: DNA-processing protein DprA [Smithellaceae bacterium]|nr:DNA-processing protein DprA [Smithellaceae bacterium]